MTSSSTPESRRARSTSPGNVNRIVAPRRHAPELAPHPHVDSAYVFMAVGRAILARALFIVHSMATIIQTVRIEQNDSVWLFALISLLIVFEGSYTIIMRAGDERKWFCTSLLLYIVATAPPIWLLETKLCEWREDLAKDGKSDILIDIVEFFDVFKEKVVYTDKRMQQIVLAAWTLSLLQFPFVLTVSRARKMRVAITKAYEELIMPRRRAEFWQVIRDVDIWAIILANSLQDIPFLLVFFFYYFSKMKI
ncbi:hypothetical protein WR25_16890 isoform B [Diploscapter pachys]|uniref:Uncharacterized protein n=1 Tax=Diploscapter pachys TaxID=2018661 RepID=A0A2A2LE13_9BILA|nr:hypothetical protein WR25_16890 isoform B [Diploscapter pachys]